jgi:RNA polymerase sigma factor (sigma-70 family)
MAMARAISGRPRRRRAPHPARGGRAAPPFWRTLGRALLLTHGGQTESQAADGGRAAEGRDDVAGGLPRFESFFRAYEGRVFGYLLRMTGDEQAAHDLSQETFLRAWRHFARISTYETPAGWLFRVATNLALSARRRRRLPAGAPVPLPFGDDAPAQSDPALRIVEADAVQRTLLALAPKQSAALVLREVYGLSCEEVGAALGVSRDAAKMLLLRGRDEFRLRYEREGGQL